jgi:hypothetical protein
MLEMRIVPALWLCSEIVVKTACRHAEWEAGVKRDTGQGRPVPGPSPSTTSPNSIEKSNDLHR